jgi:hypothetical protein
MDLCGGLLVRLRTVGSWAGILLSSPPSLLYLDIQTPIYITLTPAIICCTEDPLPVNPFPDSRLQSDKSMVIA